MAEVYFLKTDEDFVKLVKLIAAFSLETGNPFWKCLNEVASCFISDRHLTIIGMNDEGEMVGYMCGYFITNKEFLVAQAYNIHSGIDSREAWEMMEYEIIRRGATRAVGFTLEPKLYEKHGFSFNRYLVAKDL